MSQLFKDYCISVNRTANKSLERNEQVLNGTLGVADEYFEILELLLNSDKIDKIREDLILEIGDLLWYTTYLWTLFEFEPIDLETLKSKSECNLESILRSSVQNAVRLTTLIKHAYFHKHSLNIDYLKDILLSIFSDCVLIAEYVNIPIAEIMKKNIIKLKKRYPDGFSTEASINRNA